MQKFKSVGSEGTVGKGRVYGVLCVTLVCSFTREEGDSSLGWGIRCSIFKDGNSLVNASELCSPRK